MKLTIPSIFSVAGTTISTMVGGFDMLLEALLIFMALDYLTGLLAAFKRKKVNSEIMYWGGIRKGIVIVVVVIATIADGLIGLDPPVMRTLAILFYISREGISILENVGKLGVPLPHALRQYFEQLKEQGGDEDKRGGGKR